MIKQGHIDGRVQKAFDNKVKSLKKQFVSSDNQFFPLDKTTGFLDITTENPIDQEFYRATFAKVSVAVPDIDESINQNKIVRQPISLSSYMNGPGQNSIIDTDKDFYKYNKNSGPLSFNQRSGEKPQQGGDNRFRGHSGIKSIKAAQQEFYTYQYTIEWECPDPVYFDKVFEPAFLKLGAAITLEFGYGDNLAEVKIPPITIEDMERYLKSQKLSSTPETIRERNLRAPGTYYCDIGTITKFDYKLTEGGGYAGSLIALSMGSSPLLETNDVGDVSDNSNDVRRQINNLSNFDKLSRELFNEKGDALTEEQQTEVFKSIIQSSTDVKTLLTSGITFNAVMKNIDKVLDKYFEINGVEETIYTGERYYTESKNIFGEEVGGARQFNFKNEPPVIKNKFKDGAMYFDFEVGTILGSIAAAYESLQTGTASVVGGVTGIGLDTNTALLNWLNGKIEAFGKGASFNDEYTKNTKLRRRYHMSWGFFEDIILGSFFELKANVTEDSDGQYIQRIRSVSEQLGIVEDNIGVPVVGDADTGETLSSLQSNKCISSEHLYSLGLDKVMLPGKTHSLLLDPLSRLEPEQKSQVSSIYSAEQLRTLDVIRTIYKMFDDYYNSFNIGDKGSIRNMVFPVELYKTHFENSSSLRQSLVDFWNDVSSMYGGYWRFAVGQSPEDNLTIGVSDLRLAPPNPDEITNDEDLQTENEKQLAKINKCYVFNLYSEDSIIKSFDLSLDISSEQAVLARYGKSKGDKPKGKTTSLSDLSVEAWNLLHQSPTAKDLEQKGITLEKYQTFLELQPEILKDLSYPSETGKSRAYVTGDYKQTKPNLPAPVRERNEDGITWKDIPEIDEDTAQELEKIDNDFSSLYKGIGIYDKNGNMSSFFKQTMLYLLNTAKIIGSGSIITTHPILMPVSISMSLDGIGGLRVGDMFKVDYLPKPYREHTYFIITKVDHSVAQSGWSTDIEAIMQMIPESYFKANPNKAISAQAEDLIELFSFEKLNFEDIISNIDDTNDSKLSEMIDGITKKIDTADEIIRFLESGGTQGRVPGSMIKIAKTASPIFVLGLAASGQSINIPKGYEKTINDGFSQLESIRKTIDSDFRKIKQLTNNISVFKQTVDDIEKNVDNAYTRITFFLDDYDLGKQAARAAFNLAQSRSRTGVVF